MRYARFLIFSCVLVTACTTALAQAVPGNKSKTEFRNSPDVSAPAGYSHVAIVNSGKMLFVSGQVGLDNKGQMVGKDDFRAQAAQAFTNLQFVLAAAGATSKDVVKLNYYVVGLNHDKLVSLREVRDQFVDKAHPPASTLAGVQELFREDALIEIEAVAVVP